MIYRILTLVTLLFCSGVFSSQAATGRVHAITVDRNARRNVRKMVFPSINEALRQAERYAFDTIWTEIRIAPGVYWIDNPDAPETRRPEKGDNTPFGMKLKLNHTRIMGTGSQPDDVVLACNRGQTQGADGNFTMLHIEGSDIAFENLTLGNYCNVDLNYRLDVRQSRKRRADAIVQAQLVIANGDRYAARRCRFISRLNLCPFAGARHADFYDCYFECTDDALCGTGTYRRCRFTLFSSKPFYATSPQGALFEDCDIHSKVNGTQYLTKVSSPVTLRRCRWTSDDPDLKIEWTRKPNPKHRCMMEDCTLNGKQLIVPPTPDVPMPFGMPTMPIINRPEIAPGKWTLDAYKPADTAGYDWQADNSRPAWCFGEGVDGAEGCYGLIQNVRGARIMYSGKSDETYRAQKLTLNLDPCKTAGQGFGSATGQYLDICIKFDPTSLSGIGIRFIRTPDYDHAVEICLIEYRNGIVKPLTTSVKCQLFRPGCRLSLSCDSSAVTAVIKNSSDVQRLSAPIHSANDFGGILIQHTGSTGASATVISSLHCEYEDY